MPDDGKPEGNDMFAEVTNADRAAWAETALEAFHAAVMTDEEDAIADLVCNLMHLQRRRNAEEGKPFDATEWARDRANMHDMEVAEDREGDDDDCGQCKGTGTIEGGLSGDGDDEQCPVCDGTGALEASA